MSRPRAFFWTLGTFSLLFLIVFAVQYYTTWQHWLAYATGSYNTPGVAHNYNSFSGSLSDVGEITLATAALGILYHILKRNNCHTHGCWRIGRLPVGDYRVCKRHHHEATGAKVDMDHLQFIHRLHQRKRLLDAGFKPGELWVTSGSVKVDQSMTNWSLEISSVCPVAPGLRAGTSAAISPSTVKVECCLPYSRCQLAR